MVGKIKIKRICRSPLRPRNLRSNIRQMHLRNDNGNWRGRFGSVLCCRVYVRPHCFDSFRGGEIKCAGAFQKQCSELLRKPNGYSINGQLFIGLMRHTPLGDGWAWTDGSQVDFLNFLNGIFLALAPSNRILLDPEDGEDCAFLDQASIEHGCGFRTGNCTSATSFFCEIDMNCAQLQAAYCSTTLRAQHGRLCRVLL